MNALASITLFTSTLVIALALLFYRRRTKGERREGRELPRRDSHMLAEPPGAHMGMDTFTDGYER